MGLKKTILFSSFLLCSFTLNLSCNKCKDSLADLITKIAFTASTSIKAGQKLKIPNLIENVLDSANDCLEAITQDAEESSSRIKLDYDPTSNGNYSKNVLNNNFDISSIGAGDKVQELYELQFNDPGEYRLITICDDKKDVKERNEKNNSSPNEDFDAKSSSPRTGTVIIRVLPNPDFQKRPGQPEAQILSRTVTYIPQ